MTNDMKSLPNIIQALELVSNRPQFGFYKPLNEYVFASVNVNKIFCPTFLVAELPDLKFGMLTTTSFFGPEAPSCGRFLVMVTLPSGELNLSTTFSVFSGEIPFDERFDF